ncbi:hypothetical protein EU527_05465 [Candidatus Thorarchaeota archaeon]|nr:MAG: hypothetical protein EU527_05465 [Candidatus Thorarchaeota archaeon]
MGEFIVQSNESESQYEYSHISREASITLILFFLWNYPIREPTTPWENMAATKPWWEQDTEDTPETIGVEDDKDKLW